MFSMQLLFAVAGGLLILNTNQAKAAIRQSRTTTRNQKQLLLAAWLKNDNATSVLDKLIPLEPQLQRTKNALSKAKDYLNELLQEKATNRSVTLTKTLHSELRGFYGRALCSGLSQCNQTYIYVQLATGDMIGAILKEDTIDDTKKNHIKGIISGNITEEGYIVEGASVRQTYDVAVKVWYYLDGFCGRVCVSQ